MQKHGWTIDEFPALANTRTLCDISELLQQEMNTLKKMDAIFYLTIISGIIAVVLSSVTYYKGKQKELEGDAANKKLLDTTLKIADLQGQLLSEMTKNQQQSNSIITLQNQLQQASDKILALSNDNLQKTLKDKENIAPYVKERLHEISNACQQIRRSIYFATFNPDEPLVGAPDIEYLDEARLKTKLEHIPLFAEVPVMYVQDRGQHWQEFFLNQGNKMKLSISQILTVANYVDSDIIKDLNKIQNSEFFKLIEPLAKLERAHLYADSRGANTRYSPDNISTMYRPLNELFKLIQLFENKYDKYDFVFSPFPKK